jgi:hypothetical protein
LSIGTDVVAYLSSKGIRTYKAAGTELTAHCFMACDGHDQKGKGKLYINSDSWLYDCKKCGSRGGRKSLLEFFGDADRDDLSWAPGTDPSLRRKAVSEAASLAQEMLLNNAEVLAYLEGRGLAMKTIVDARIGYVPTNWALGGSLRQTNDFRDLRHAGLLTAEGQEFFSGHITIPYLSYGDVVQLRGRAFVPGKKLEGAKYVTPAGDSARLFNVDSMRGAREVICVEGEFDALMVTQALRASQDPAVRATAVVGIAGAQTLPEGFAAYFENVRRAYIAFDPDDAGDRGAEKVMAMLGSKARKIELPRDLPECDWSDYLRPKSEDNPHGGHDWRDIRNLMHDADAAGRVLYTPRDVFAQWRRIENEVGGVETGIRGLDRHIAPGLKPGQIMIPLARTGNGKSAFLASLTYNMRSRPTLILSLEMTAAEYWDRLIRIARFWNPLLSDEGIEAEYQNLRIYDRRIKPGDVLRLCDEFSQDVGEGPQVVMLDYLGYASKGYPGTSQYERVTRTVLEAKEDAKAGGYALVMPHQAGRTAVDGAPVREQDARDSGAVEDSADVLMGLFRPSESGAVGFDGGVTCAILKNRNGRKGVQAQLLFSLASLVIVEKGTPEARFVEDENRLILSGENYTKVLNSRRANATHQLVLR